MRISEYIVPKVYTMPWQIEGINLNPEIDNVYERERESAHTWILIIQYWPTYTSCIPTILKVVSLLLTYIMHSQK